jgi:hypothetical protein
MSDANHSKSPIVSVRRQKIQSLRDALSQKQPAAFGTLSIQSDQSTIFYGKKGNTEYAICDHSSLFAHWLTDDLIISRINLSNASEADLQHLSDACQPATFGVNGEDVLDESYRKAGKMDVTDFATNFVVEDSGMMDIIRSELLEGHESNKAIKAELYKLNVYRRDRRYGLTLCLAHTPFRQRSILQITQGRASQQHHVWITRHCISNKA